MAPINMRRWACSCQLQTIHVELRKGNSCCETFLGAVRGSAVTCWWTLPHHSCKSERSYFGGVFGLRRSPGPTFIAACSPKSQAAPATRGHHLLTAPTVPPGASHAALRLGAHLRSPEPGLERPTCWEHWRTCNSRLKARNSQHATIWVTHVTLCAQTPASPAKCHRHTF